MVDCKEELPAMKSSTSSFIVKAESRVHVYRSASVSKDLRLLGYLQFGLLVEGLAITMPEAAPWSLAPLEPMLANIPPKAVVDSDDRKLARSPEALASIPPEGNAKIDGMLDTKAAVRRKKSIVPATKDKEALRVYL